MSRDPLMLGLNVGGKPPVTPTSASDTHPSLPLLQSNDTSVEAYEGDPEDDEEYEEEEQTLDDEDEDGDPEDDV